METIVTDDGRVCPYVTQLNSAARAVFSAAFVKSRWPLAISWSYFTDFMKNVISILFRCF